MMRSNMRNDIDMGQKLAIVANTNCSKLDKLQQSVAQTQAPTLQKKDVS